MAEFELGDKRNGAVALSSATYFRTFDEMATVISENVPHALVQDWWSRLEGTIREICARRGVNGCPSVATLISKHLPKHPAVSAELIRELHAMRKLRNQCAHGEAPPLSPEEGRAYAHRAWTIGWDLAVADDRAPANLSLNSDNDVPAA